MTRNKRRRRPLRKLFAPVRDDRRTAVSARPVPRRAVPDRAQVTDPGPDPDGALDGIEFGRVGALAGQGQRDLTRIAAGYPELFGSRPFDPAMFAAIALASSASAPWLDPVQLRLVNRMSLWLFGLDQHAERLAVDAVEALARRLLAVAAGAKPRTTGSAAADNLVHLLAVIRDDLAGAVAGFVARRPVWLDALRCVLAAVAREQRWRDGRKPPPREYLDNAASTGFGVVFTTVWLTETGASQVRPGRDLAGAVAAAERVLRLVNDLGTAERERVTGDLNVLTLGLTRAQVAAELEESTDRMLILLTPLRLDHPRLATYVERQVGYATGLYGIGDFWGPR